ncbi:MAG: NAD(P)/FAD-dependent oxidoreductase [Agriterribacter sp.]
MFTENFDVIIIGGSYAGLSAAMALGRSLRNTLIIDAGKPCNQQTPHSHNFITHDGETPGNIRDKAKAQVLAYKTVQLVNDTAITAVDNTGSFSVQTSSGKNYQSKKILFATGILDILPPIKGFAECWGISVLHCPYCHGYEVRYQKTGIIASGEGAVEYAKLISNWTNELAIFTNGAPAFSDAHAATLQKTNANVYPQEIEAIEHVAGQVSTVHLKDGSRVTVPVIYHRPSFQQHSPLPETLGCSLTSNGFIQVDGMQKTTMPGIFAAGDNSTGFRSVAEAVAAGNKAGAVINKELIEETFAT